MELCNDPYQSSSPCEFDCRRTKNGFADVLVSNTPNKTITRIGRTGSANVQRIGRARINAAYRLNAAQDADRHLTEKMQKI